MWETARVGDPHVPRQFRWYSRGGGEIRDGELFCPSPIRERTFPANTFRRLQKAALFIASLLTACDARDRGLKRGPWKEKIGDDTGTPLFHDTRHLWCPLPLIFPPPPKSAIAPRPHFTKTETSNSPKKIFWNRLQVEGGGKHGMGEFEGNSLHKKVGL